MLMREDSHLASKVVKPVFRSTSMVAWCVATLFALLMTLPLVHASSHREPEIAAGLNSGSHIPDRHDDEDSETCEECVALVFGRLFGAATVPPPAQVYCATVGIEPEIAADSPYVIRHSLPPPSRGPPILM